MDIFLTSLVLLTSNGNFQWTPDKTHGEFIERVEPKATGEIEIHGNLGTCMVYPYEDGVWAAYVNYTTPDPKKLVVKFSKAVENKLIPQFGSFTIYCRRENGQRGENGKGGADSVQPVSAIRNKVTRGSFLISQTSRIRFRHHGN